jgi:uncharacterized protein YgiM (DUF1202 family)
MKTKLLLAAALLLLCGPSAAQTLYVQSLKAKLHTEPSSQSPQLAELPKGAAVETVEKTDRWVKVTHGAQTGWISSLVLAAQPPAKKISVMDAPVEEDAAKPGARLRASSNNTAAATRGLRGETRARMSEEGQADYSALETVKSQAASEQEAADFLSQGVKQGQAQ